MFAGNKNPSEANPFNLIPLTLPFLEKNPFLVLSLLREGSSYKLQ